MPNDHTPRATTTARATTPRHPTLRATATHTITPIPMEATTILTQMDRHTITMGMVELGTTLQGRRNEYSAGLRRSLDAYHICIGMWKAFLTRLGAVAGMCMQ